MKLMVLICFLVSGCHLVDYWQGRRDLDQICEVTTNYKPKPDETHLEQIRNIADQWTKVIDSKVVKQIMGALATLVDQRYKMLEESAEEIGYDNFSCPALKKLWAVYEE